MDAEIFYSLRVIQFLIHDVEVSVTTSKRDFRALVHGKFYSVLFDFLTHSSILSKSSSVSHYDVSVESIFKLSAKMNAS